MHADGSGRSRSAAGATAALLIAASSRVCAARGRLRDASGRAGENSPAVAAPPLAA